MSEFPADSRFTSCFLTKKLLLFPAFPQHDFSRRQASLSGQVEGFPRAGRRCAGVRASARPGPAGVAHDSGHDSCHDSSIKIGRFPGAEGVCAFLQRKARRRR